jgi:hypothetical protein
MSQLSKCSVNLNAPSQVMPAAGKCRTRSKNAKFWKYIICNTCILHFILFALQNSNHIKVPFALQCDFDVFASDTAQQQVKSASHIEYG